MTCQLQKAITQAQYDLIWDTPEGRPAFSDNEPILSKVW